MLNIGIIKLKSKKLKIKVSATHYINVFFVKIREIDKYFISTLKLIILLMI